MHVCDSSPQEAKARGSWVWVQIRVWNERRERRKPGREETREASIHERMLFVDSVHSRPTECSAYNGFIRMWPYCNWGVAKPWLFSRNTETTPPPTHTHIHTYTHVSLHTFIHAHLYIKKEPPGKTHTKQLPGHSLKFLDACGKTTQLCLLSHPVGCGGSSLRCRML